MTTCKEVSEIVSQSLDRDLGLHERVRLRLHLLICRGCARFNRQMQWLRDATKLATEAEQVAGPGLSTAARERIARRLDDRP
ncbi:MAG: zf-HC2 domain-containing protein [Pseudomonadota bacterium]|nr:MAG: zf-HC2 domain-containing protein [Pseudomonadota bacterium]